MKIDALRVLCIFVYHVCIATGSSLRKSGNADTAALTQLAVEAAPANSTPAAAKHAICDASLPGFSEDRCFMHSLGRTPAQLRAHIEALNIRNASIGLGNASHSQADATSLTSAHTKSSNQCKKLFHLFKMETFEHSFPEVAACHVTWYAALVYMSASQSPCWTADLNKADVLMVPPYLAQECNWPSYGEGDCHSTFNTYRHGTLCTTQVTEVVAKLQKEYPSKPVLLVDHNRHWEPYNLPKVEYTVPGRIWAKVNSMSPPYRAGIDISMAPAAVERCQETPDKAWDEPLSAKKWFVTFKGQLRTPIRATIANMFNNGKDQFLVDSVNAEFDFDELLQGSRFNLILGGDVEFSYRFNEAVCSGGVPVLVTDRWVPPFGEFLPFESYGVLVKEAHHKQLMSILRALPDNEVEERRKNARKYCKSSFQTTEATVQALMRHITG